MVGTRRQVVTYSLTPLLALALAQALNQGEQISLSQAVSGIKHEFHTTDAVVGILPFASAVTGLAASFPFGRLTDRSRRTVLLAAAMLSWTVFMGLGAMSVSLLMLFAMRMGLGAIEASSMAGLSLIGDYYPVEVRAKRIGQWSAGSLIGAAFALGAGGPLVDAWGWRAAFWMWVPLGIVSAVFMLRQPEPERGLRDAEFLEAAPAEGLALPTPRRLGTGDYSDLSVRAVIAETRQIGSFWLVTVAITIANLINASAQFWGIEYFKRVHHLSTASAGGVAVLLGAGSGAGIVLSGVLADRRLARGDVNGRLHVAIAGCAMGTLFLTPAWVIGNLGVAAPLFFLGSLGLTLPVPAVDAVLTDIVVAELRGRAIMVRSIVRILSNLGPALVGGLSLACGLDVALSLVTPVLAVGALALLRALRHYPHDLAFACAESQRLLGG